MIVPNEDSFILLEKPILDDSSKLSYTKLNEPFLPWARCSASIGPSKESKEFDSYEATKGPSSNFDL
ncbi:hypothetical protein PanWU01x14_232470 [Parasponia andersonii]|uniref:Uncharacterized protein n=1 Tax=Parasponia andersonii TaxID=3476 RepID=A0A2P5BJX7_PARAD|nr:hypothetical protein PanWU01x14_232470 [Parasponia andersonii]